MSTRPRYLIEQAAGSVLHLSSLLEDQLVGHTLYVIQEHHISRYLKYYQQKTCQVSVIICKINNLSTNRNILNYR